LKECYKVKRRFAFLASSVSMVTIIEMRYGLLTTFVVPAKAGTPAFVERHWLPAQLPK
jgi:hypothetical protein